MEKQRLMKDGLNRYAVERMANSIQRVYPEFKKAQFVDSAIPNLDTLELKDRVRHLIRTLKPFLPAEFPQTANLLVQLKDHWDPGDPNDNLAGFAAWPVIDYIGEHGLNHPEEALNALKELTGLFSAEFAVRPFFIHHPNLTLQMATEWTQADDEHIRRLASEGSRPRLPWGQHLPQFIADPSPVIALLENLKDDPSEYVRRSVANNLNDISKDHPDAVISLCRRWQKKASPERLWIIRHSTRTLVKSGHPAVFGLLGFTENPQLNIRDFTITPETIQLGESITFSFILESTSPKPQTLVIDYAVHHRKANGQTSPKVFKFKQLEIGGRETIRLQKKHAVKAITTRTYYPGEHAVEILINGRSHGKTTFQLNSEEKQ